MGDPPEAGRGFLSGLRRRLRGFGAGFAPSARVAARVSEALESVSPEAGGVPCCLLPSPAASPPAAAVRVSGEQLQDSQKIGQSAIMGILA